MHYHGDRDENYTVKKEVMAISEHITPNLPVGEIVAHMPRAAEIFKKYKIDFCCGGSRPLSEAIRDNNLDEQEIMAKLEEAQHAAAEKQGKEIDWRSAPLSDIVDYVVDTHHSYLNRALPRLSELTTAILRAHGANHQELKKVHRLFHDLKAALEAHLIDEEEVIFSLVKNYEEDQSAISLSRAVTISKKLEEEHDEAGGILRELREITRDYAVPDDACGTYDAAYEELEELENDMFQHIHLENNILHPRLKEELMKVQNQN